ncbi:MAG: hypothetical protein HWE08_09800 [Alphaproteobacteria bacterium]|nr:hypothetical protein [Alphaproteobacteria bacterium]
MPMKLRFIMLLLIPMLVACDPISQVPSSPPAVVGTRAVIQRHRQEIYAEITAVTGKLVTTEMYLQGESIAEFSAYRGLYPVSGREPHYQYEADFDEAVLEQLFPLKTGNEVSFSGNLKRLDRGTSYDFWSHVAVVGEKTLSLSSGPRKVFVVDIITETSSGDRSKRRTQTVYFDPEYSMVLKSVQHEDGYKNYWFVVSVELPGEETNRTAPPRPRSGTVII